MDDKIRSLSFSYIIEQGNDIKILSDIVYVILANLFNNGVLSIKPVRIEDYYTKNNNDEDVYNIKVDFDIDDKTEIEDIMSRFI